MPRTETADWYEALYLDYGKPKPDKEDDKLKDILQAAEPILIEYSQTGTEKAYAKKVLARLRKALETNNETTDKGTRKKVSRRR